MLGKNLKRGRKEKKRKGVNRGDDGVDEEKWEGGLFGILVEARVVLEAQKESWEELEGALKVIRDGKDMGVIRERGGKGERE